MKDEKYMKMAIELAKLGCGAVNPNPMVGAVIVKEGRVIARGYHEKYGGLHAERNAFKNCRESCEGATLYVTLEPCCHYGKTPPCTEAIIKHKIARVVIGLMDPNPLVAGKGIQILKEHGILVTTGVLEAECRQINEVFLHYIKEKKPYVVMKYAMTMDGKIATRTGKSQWITNEQSREHVHETRNQYTAIMIGIGTVLKDDPLLTCRIPNGRNPIRIVCDTSLQTPILSRLVQTAKEVRTIIATAEKDENKHKQYLQAGCDVMVIPKKDGHLDLRQLVLELGKKEIDSILLEGGAILNESALRNQIVQKVQTYIAPKIIGGEMAKTPVGGIGVDRFEECYQLVNSKIYHFGEDLLIESEVRYPCLQES